MEYNRKFIFLILLFIFVLNHAGCSGITDYIKVNQQEDFDASIVELNAIRANIEQHIGKHKDELRMILGEPSEVISPSIWDNVKYDEEWVYEQGVSFLNKQYRMFYIKEDIIAHVEFGGIY